MATWVADGPAGVVLRHSTTRAEGDFSVGAERLGLARRRRGVAGHPWVWLRQVHGADVVVVTADGRADAVGVEADALVTAEPELVLAVQTADCVPITFHSPEGVIGLAHAGWRGLEAGVVDATLGAMADLGATSISHEVGPHIMGACYEFGSDDLDRLAGRFGARVRTTTETGAAALDLDEVLAASLGRRSSPDTPHGHESCTACHPERWFSHRARGERERMATVIWRERSPERALIRR
jgi:YfiH family protein